jgi:transposase InsO family protein
MDMQTLTQMTLVVELAAQGLSHTKIAAHLGKHRETIGLWLQGIATYGLVGFFDRHTQAKKGPRRARQVPARIKRLIWELRVRELDCCGQKIAYFLEREYHLRLSVPKIYEILAEKYVIRSKWRKNQKRGAVPKAACARAVIQMDTVAFGHLFAFTGIDIYTKEAAVMLRPTLTSDDGAAFLHTAMARRFTGRVEILQTDGGPEFKGAFAQQARAYCDRHRIARPYKKNEQAYIESFNRTLRKECLGWGTYRAGDLSRLIPEVETFLARYHYHRPHLGFSPMRPPLQTSPTQEDGLSDFYGE